VNKLSSEVGKLLKKGQYNEALQKASKVALDDIKNGRLHEDLVIEWRVHRRDKELMPKEVAYQDEAIQRFMKRNKGNKSLGKALAHYKLGLLYENMSPGWFKMNVKRLEEAIGEYDKALSLFPDFAPALFRKGSVYSALEKLEEALKSYVEAGETDSQFCEAFFFQGVLHTVLGDWDKAVKSYKKAVAIDNDNAAAHTNMGLIYMRKEEYELAEKEFEEVLRILPNHSAAKKNLLLAKSRKEKHRQKIASE
jgi:tetratricopeptide (TPR) repeat protein